MSLVEERCLLVLVEEALKTTDCYVVSALLPVEGLDERNAVAASLEKKGFIDRIKLIGKQYLGCQVKESALRYALKYYKQRTTVDAM